MKTTTKTTNEYAIDDFSAKVLELLYPGKNAKIEYVISEVGTDYSDRGGYKAVTAVRIVYDHADELFKQALASGYMGKTL